ncbi:MULTISPECIES: SDR family oxidoreductase [unclassified Polaromonas]|jgi:short-subunit dehydrogenase|uniref:SDR family oxidoreductase n=1 Tax=unclassified Polaromonas TaxID=2638319 RepID=UPI000BD20D76|nr:MULTISPECIES: SDR family oxidoreductase [unclassified Polaromonas]OYY35242.1 MAG: short chain dehydrogenase [Polaromonas sp. 35-63-35]OYZ19153.1 MAG: short chain dehydrogenase [Polaromonas sp. 16-63-31]OYZ78253.1 MAG: short chain dehydrogenase [Polaromonas sp. 24-63-21]OZA48811.1 MAG: short chain dehydrogenase [Polaromonas sp. 17-63-33]OZA87698.1 MAG: short chain dehydrogenase [Polaromonas sp. 39-63-25]
MQLNQARILLTGASGGLGRDLARELAGAGAAVLLAGRDAVRLAAIKAELGASADSVVADLTTAEGIAAANAAARAFGVNVLINNAGVGSFGLFDQQAWPTVEQVLATNLEAPLRLTQALLPWLKAQPTAAIVNVGSMFGSLPYPGFAAYSAAKAGLRGFSQALRRELADTPVAVIHIAPRVIDTPLNTEAVNQLNRALKNNSDSSQAVARQIVAALRHGKGEHHFGFPERLFAWLNGFAPSLIDRGLAGQLAIIKQHAPSSEQP